MLTHLIHNKQLIPKENWRLLLWRYPPGFLESLLHERQYDGKISVTTCMRCPREHIFKMKFPYAIDPEDMAFAILGTKAHSNLESDHESIMTEQAMDIEIETDMKGILDTAFVLNDELWLGDNKTWGSYAVAKNMGLREEYRPKLDENGEPEYYKSSRKGYYEKGDPKKEKHWVPDDTLAENFDVTMQLNMYRIMLERLIAEGKVNIQNLGSIKKIKHLVVYCIVRDGNTFTAKGRGILGATYAIPIKILPDEEVLKFFNEKATYIKSYYDKHSFSTTREILRDPPDMGTNKETLDGWICNNSCPVTHLCRLCERHPEAAERITEFGLQFDINTGGLRNK